MKKLDEYLNDLELGVIDPVSVDPSGESYDIFNPREFDDTGEFVFEENVSIPAPTSVGAVLPRTRWAKISEWILPVATGVLATTVITGYIFFILDSTY